MNRILIGLAVVAAAAGAAIAAHLVRPLIPAAPLFVVAGLFVLVYVLRLLPVGVRRPVVFALTFLALVGAGGGLYYFQFVVRPQMARGFLAAALAPKPTAVSVETVAVEKWPPRLEAIGTVRAYQGVDVAPQVAGVVSAIHFASGDDVAAGALLINLDDSVEQADLKNGQAQLRNAEISLDRQRQLVAGGSTAIAQVDAALATRDSAAATVERAQALIAEKAIKAPFAGRLGIRNVDVGQYVAVGSTLVTLQELDPIYVDFQTPDEALSRLAVGEEVSMTVGAFPGVRFAGKVTAIDARVNQETRNALVRAQFANPDRKLLPGMFANVEVTTGAPADVVTVARTSVVYSLYGDAVFVAKPAPPKAGEAQAAEAKPGLVVERRFVRVGATRGERVAIEEGASPGERVVTSGQIKLMNGAPVTIDEAEALPPPARTPKP